MPNVFRYRDSQTGYFVKESTYNRSVSHGGTRYRQEEIKPKEEEPGGGPDEDLWEEWAVTFEYEG